MTSRTDSKMPGTPSPWVNATMRGLLATPVVRAALGKLFAVITVTGARTGRRYTTPVQYVPVDETFVVLSQVHRRWWRNLRDRPEVDLLVRGKLIHGHATIEEAGEAAHMTLARVLERDPRVAKVYGLHPDATGAVSPADIDWLLTQVVVLVIRPD